MYERKNANYYYIVVGFGSMINVNAIDVWYVFKKDQLKLLSFSRQYRCRFSKLNYEFFHARINANYLYIFMGLVTLVLIVEF